MKVILIKTEDDLGRYYVLKGRNLPENYTLCQEKCDALFGVVDVEKLAKEESNDEKHSHIKLDYQDGIYYGFQTGFNKCAQLNKDKLFTVEDMQNAFLKGVSLQIDFPTFQKSLQKTTEIEVRIVMKNSRTGKIVKSDFDLEWDEDGLCDRAIPSYDHKGNLMLEKI